MSRDLELIKKHYGEKMMHYCRSNFPTLLETEGLLYSLLDNHFEHSRMLYDDIVKSNAEIGFKSYILGLVKNTDKIISTNKSPKELLSEAGYDLYVCGNEADIQSFKKYYNPGEYLCTFNGDRLDRCYVFFAVKKDVDSIRREEYLNPSRQDKYGTSVISIQFDKGELNTLSIKNRYNHKVNYPDATFSNNLENIIPGLTESFTREYGFNIQSNEGTLELDDYKYSNGRYYKYNYGIRNFYYCPNNLIINDDEEVNKDYQSERFILADYYVIDLSRDNRSIRLYDSNIKDSFTSDFNNLDGTSKIKKINVQKYEDGSRRIEITINEPNDAEIVIDKNGRIIGYRNDTLKELEDGFMFGCKYLTNIDMPNVEKIGEDCLFMCDSIKEIRLPKVKKVGYGFLRNDSVLTKLDGPLVESFDDDCLYKANDAELNTPNLRETGYNFMHDSNKEKIK